jgi:hypothetical protein
MFSVCVRARWPVRGPDLRGAIHCVAGAAHSILMLAELMIGVHLATSLFTSLASDCGPRPVFKRPVERNSELVDDRLWCCLRSE